MSDLISKEALIKELNELRRYVPFPSSKDVLDIIMKAKAIEQGEAVAYLYRCKHKQPNPKYTEWACVSNNAHWPVDQWQSYEVLPLYTSPQQPQSVADAMEDVAKLCDELAEQDYCVDVRVASEAIRALIKRNAKEGE